MKLANAFALADHNIEKYVCKRLSKFVGLDFVDCTKILLRVIKEFYMHCYVLLSNVSAHTR